MEWLPDILQQWGDRTAAMPGYVLPAAGIAAALLCAFGAHWLLFFLLNRWAAHRVGAVTSLVRRARKPLRLAFLLAGVIVALNWVDLRYGWQATLQHIALILLIVLLGWTAIVLTQHFTDRSVKKYRFDTDDNLAARKYVTQVRVLRRTALIVIGILTVIAVLLTFEGVREYGISLFASAGAAGLILGLAARPVLTNLIAGVQIAITQPIRLEDVVIVEGEWGWIEEIFATFVVVRIWDWRRMVVPLSYFIEQPFQNWTRESASVIGAVFWYLDYTVPVDRVRAKVEELVDASPHWDGQVVNLQVTDTDKDTITLRGLMSARTSPQAWDLRCEIREKLIVWLQAEYPQALPRLRGELQMLDAESGPTAQLGG